MHEQVALCRLFADEHFALWFDLTTILIFFDMGKKESLIPSLAVLLTKAKPLHEWTRTAVLNPTVHQQMSRSAEELDDQPKLLSTSDLIAEHHQKLDNFFSNHGFSNLPKKHIAHRFWNSQIASARKQENKERVREKRRRESRRAKAKNTSG